MKFTSYYSKVVKSNGVPQLSVKQHQHLMNILHVEAGIYHMSQLQSDGQSAANKNRALFNLQNQLLNLTQKHSPEEILHTMLEQSQ